jgi:hypothetical protein
VHLRPPPSRTGTALAAVPLVFLGVALLLQATQPLWWDEIYTTVAFIRPGAAAAVTGEYHANNHRLYTLLAQASVATFSETEASLRAASIIATAGSAIGLGWLLLRYIGTWSGTLGLSSFAFSPLVLHWGPQARGYGLTLLASVGLLASALALVTGQPRVKGWMWLLAVSGAVGTATLPHFLVPFWITIVGVGLARRSLAVAVAVRATAGTLLALAIYVPGLTPAVTRYSGGTRGISVAPIDGLLGPFRFLVIGQMPGPATLRTLLPPAVTVAMVAVIGLAVTVSILGWWSRRDHAIAVAALAPLFGTFTVLAVQRVTMTDRTLMFLLPQLTFAVAYGFQGMKRLPITPPRASVTVGTAGVVLATVIAASAMVDGWVRAPIEDFRAAVRLATDQPGFAPISDTRYPMAVHFYDEDDAVTYLPTEDVDRLLCTDRSRSYAYIHHRIGRRSRPPAGCLQQRNGVRIEISQRTRGPLEVWFVP